MSLRTELTFLCLCVLLVGSVAFASAAPTPTVSALEKDGNPKTAPMPPPPYLDVLENLGILVDYPDPKKVVPLNWEVLRRHNLLIMTNSPFGFGWGTLDEKQGQEIAELVDRYLQEGGGVLYIGQALSIGWREHDAMNAWLKQYGAQFEWATIDDDEHSYRNPPPVPWQRPNYLWTTNIAASPITEGVKTLFYQNGFFYGPSIRPLQVSNDWQVLVSSMPSAVVSQVTRPPGGGVLERIKGTEKTGAVPLIAVRQVGKGRLALFGADPGPFYYDLGRQVGAQVSSVRGDGQTPSDWLPLLRNLCVWLSEPARQAGFPGGATERARTFVNPEYGSRDPIDWRRPDLAWPDSEIYRLYAIHAGAFDVDYWREAAAGHWKPFKFLVGAHSRASGGKGSVAEWKAAARRAGFDGVIFREKILEMTKEQWEAFEAECYAASDDTFLAIPGQEYTDWIGQRFMRFQKHFPYFLPERLTKDGKFVKDQLSFFFDAGWPAHFPLTPQKNATAFWNYRVYSAYPIAVYQGGRQVENNRSDWHSLVQRMEYPTPLGVHLLEDPAEVAAAADDYNLILLAPSLSDIWNNPRWVNGSLGTGTHNIAVAYASNGPIIEAFLPLNHYRATLGSRGVPGSYRWRLVIRARSEVPLKIVEVWGGGECLRRYRPGAKQFMAVMDEEHSRQRGLMLRVVDANNREALATSIMVHDKMMVWYWCGDHCNALPYGQGVDKDGNPTGLGLVTHVKGAFQPAGGPGGTFGEAWDYIPYGTDTSLPGLNLWGVVRFAADKGPVPDPNVCFMSDSHFWYANRDVLITRQAVTTYAEWDKYVPKEQPTINGWYPYVLTQPTEDFDIVADDIDLHRDAGEPSLQWCRGEVRFKREVTLSDKQPLNLVLVEMGWNTVKQGLYTAQGKLAQPGTLQGKLGRGGYVTWPAELGHGSIFALDDEFSVNAAVDAEGKQSGRPAFGYNLGPRTFKKGEVFRYSFLIMRWPVGTAMADRLDEKVQKALGLAQPQTGLRLAPQRGWVLGTQVAQDLQAQDGAFVGVVPRVDLGMRVPVRVKGLNPNWTAGIWRPAASVFEPLGVDPEGWAWTSLDPATEAGTIFLGNVVSCERGDIIIRVLERGGGEWDVIAHNPLDKTITVTVRGVESGPLAGKERRVTLAPGTEMRWVW